MTSAEKQKVYRDRQRTGIQIDQAILFKIEKEIDGIKVLKETLKETIIEKGEIRAQWNNLMREFEFLKKKFDDLDI